jgi:hypothetical protein
MAYPEELVVITIVKASSLQIFDCKVRIEQVVRKSANAILLVGSGFQLPGQVVLSKRKSLPFEVVSDFTYLIKFKI